MSIEWGYVFQYGFIQNLSLHITCLLDMDRYMDHYKNEDLEQNRYIENYKANLWG